tara:strand:- start:742 stop:927 length:186 start_codon:yes stop_codon:yes gene_type:complete
MTNKDVLYRMWEREFYDKYADDENLEDVDFKGIAVGFFITLRLNIEEALLMYDECIKRGKY